MSDDIVMILREIAELSKTRIGMGQVVDNAGNCVSTRAADEIERLRALADQLAEALDISCQLNRTAVQTVAFYPQHAKDALAQYKAVRGE